MNIVFLTFRRDNEHFLQQNPRPPRTDETLNLVALAPFCITHDWRHPVGMRRFSGADLVKV